MNAAPSVTMAPHVTTTRITTRTTTRTIQQAFSTTARIGSTNSVTVSTTRTTTAAIQQAFSTTARIGSTNSDTASTTTNIPSYYIQSRLTGFVLDLEGGSLNPGTYLVASPMKNETSEDPSSQLWFFDPDGTIRNMASGLVIDISSGINGVDLVIWPMNGQGNQLWTMVDVYLVCQAANKVMDVADFNTAPGARVVAWQQNFGLNQQWNLTLKSI
ncbi:unnamed protein product [Rotaria sp. Silwood1]|nr:unnamed protein product [Rotaria sp. Silwood1]CAF1538402.1 unnamed protein product [Rotaria sp. Silwood1]CAF3748541.1 unnamed protein product [Rotaria sp. Silwood1]CAF3783496.1 unnamed protein product [Rotaria sp. Silwood1]CAF4763135.1 unnamed protein product [Rotaria sp. Silwood1]